MPDMLDSMPIARRMTCSFGFTSGPWSPAWGWIVGMAMCSISWPVAVSAGDKGASPAQKSSSSDTEQSRSQLSEEKQQRLVSLLQSARASYEREEFQTTIERMKEAYEIRPDPEFLYRIALSYERSSRPRKAITYYEQYLAAPPEVEKRGRVEATLERLRRELDKPSATASQTASESPERRRRTAPLVFASVGGGMALSSLLFGILYGQAHSDYRDTLARSRSLNREESNLSQKVSRRNTFLGLTYGTAGLAAASLGYAAYLWLTSSSAADSSAGGAEPTSSTGIDVRPIVSPAGVGLSGRF